jgi:hypothetical protein
LAYPVLYDITYSYTGFQQAQGDNSFPGTQLDADLAGLEQSIDDLATFTERVVRSDGALQNGIVTYDSLSASLQTNGIAGAVPWTALTAFLKGTAVVVNSTLYRAAQNHTSTNSFATDLGNGLWTFVAAMLGSQTAQTVLANNTGGSATPTAVPYADFADAMLGSASVGAIATRFGTPSQWGATGPGAVGQPLIGNGPGVPASFGNASAAYVTYGNTGAGAIQRTVSSRLSQIKNVFDYGAIGDGVNDDTTAIQNAINAAQAASTLINRAHGAVYAPPGYTFKTTSTLSITAPIEIDIGSVIEYATSTGTALTCFPTAPTAYGTEGGRYRFAGFKQTGGGNVSTPSSVNTAGAVAVRINSAAFNRFEVGSILGFTYRAIWVDGTGAVYAPQVGQHNTFVLGQILFNGQGIYINSTNAATSSCQVCRWDIQNIYGNFTDIRIDNTASDSHTFWINAMDNSHASGYGIQCFGNWNKFYIGYTAATIRFESGAQYNHVEVTNTIATGVVFVDVDGYAVSKNRMFSGGGDWATQVGAYLSAFTQVCTFSNTTASSAYTNGAVVVAGGLGVAKDIHSNGDMYLDNGTSGTVFLGNVSSLSRSQATGKLTLNTNASDIDFTPASGKVTNSGGFFSRSASQGIGYATGAGGAVTQATSKATGVTLNTVSGQITTNNAALAANTSVAFTLTDSAIAATDTVAVNLKSGNATPATYRVHAEAIAAGSCVVVVTNTSAGSLSEALVLNFNVVKGVNA